MLALRLVMMRLHAQLLAVLIPDLSKALPLEVLLRRFTPQRRSVIYEGISEQAIVALILQILQNPWRMRGRRCLRVGLLTFYFLRLAGIPAELRFGVYTTARPHELAHCWITVGGRCLTDPPEYSYVPILTWGDSAVKDPINTPAVP
jgi:hypothetical protein